MRVGAVSLTVMLRRLALALSAAGSLSGGTAFGAAGLGAGTMAGIAATPSHLLAQIGVLKRARDAAQPAAPVLQGDESERVDLGSPRAAMLAFLRAAREGDWVTASQWLGPATGERDRRPEQARRLKAVLDRHLEIRPEKISPRAVGDTTDGLARDREELGIIPSATHGPQPVRLIRVESPTPGWAFSPRTLELTEAWYVELGDKWLRDRAPDWFFLSGPWQVLWWQWIALLALLPVSLVVARLLRPVIGLLLLAVPAWRGAAAAEIVMQLGTPTLLVLTLVIYRLAVSPLLTMAASRRVTDIVLGALVISALAWWSMRAVTLVTRLLPGSGWAADRPGVRSTIQLGASVARMLVVIIAIIGVLAGLGYPVGTLLAGLGIGGIAVALGAQKTLEHFFGSVSIGIDQPIRVGDTVRVEDIEGEVESIGLRSTRIRTLERTVVTLPNGKLAEMRTENLSDRDRVRFQTLLGVAYGTTPAQLRSLRNALEATLRAHPHLWQEGVVVRVRDFAQSGITIEVVAWFATRDFDDFRAWREEMLLSFLEVLAAAGVRLAYPTQTLLVQGAGGGETPLPATPPVMPPVMPPRDAGSPSPG